MCVRNILIALKTNWKVCMRHIQKCNSAASTQAGSSCQTMYSFSKRVIVNMSCQRKHSTAGSSEPYNFPLRFNKHTEPISFRLKMERRGKNFIFPHKVFSIYYN